MNSENKKKIFREVALTRLSSPDQLDQLMQVSTARHWIAALAVAGGLLVAMLWGWFGSISTEVSGQAVLLRTGGLENVVVTSASRVADISVDPGEEVQQGQPVARLTQPDLLESLNTKRAKKIDLESQRSQLVAMQAKQASLQQAFVSEQRRSLTEQIAILAQRLKSQEELLTEGLIVRREMLGTRSELEEARARLLQISVNEFDASKQIQLELQSLDQQLGELERSITALYNQMAQNGTVLSPHTGKVVEVLAPPGALLNAGSPLLLLERGGRSVKNLEAVVYVPAHEGKRIKAGSRILLSPSGVLREEYGYLRGWVTSVSEYPATAPGMMRVLQNEQLVQSMLKGGTVFEVRADLVRDPKTPSGYAWTSSAGPNQQIQSGSLGSALITVHRQRPLALVIPALRNWAGL